MRTRLTAAISVLMAISVLTVAGGSSTGAAPAGSADPPTRRVCHTASRPGHVACLALLRTTADGTPLTVPAASPTAPPPGYGPEQIQAAYELTAASTSRGDTHTVAIVDAFDAPTAEADLAAYRTLYGLPACTTANGCFRKVNQDGGAAPLPPADVNWAVEVSLDLDMVSAACPRCHILLVEADDNVDTNLAAAVATAAALGATEISNSYGEPEYPGEAALEPYFDQPGVAITVASGDSGYGVGYPAASANVTSVGGTSLWRSDGSRGWSEAVWVGAGSGCSTFIRKPAWQQDGCTHRTDNDVAAVADPTTPVAVYDTYGVPGWVMVGGTSAASPIVAGIYALAENAHRDPGGSYFYRHPGQLFDVTSGSNGRCSPAYLCSGTTGYDAPTGLGTPNLTGASDTGGSCVSGWSRTPDQAAPTREQVLFADTPLANEPGIEALAPDDVWTVGSYQVHGGVGPAGTSGFVPNIEHWNGAKWRQVAAPAPVSVSGSTDAQLFDVSFDAPDDGWAVGHSGPTVLAEHWDGTRWTLSPALTPMVTHTLTGGDVMPAGAEATAVAALSPTDVWVGGNTQVGSTAHGAFLEHWDGTSWQLVDVPDSGTLPIVLTGMHAVAADDIWAVGYRQDNATGAVAEPVSLHRTGQGWTSVPMAGGANTAPRAVSGSSAGDLWAVGARLDPDVGNVVPLTEHWDGTAWTIVPTEGASSIASNRTTLRDVAAISPTDAWAVGAYSGRRAGQPNFGGLYLLEHWDGHTWSILPAPQAATDDGYWAISASSAGNVWLTAMQQLTSGLDYPYAVRYGCGNG